MKISAKNIFGFIATALLLGLLISMPVGAQAANVNAAQGIQISPALVELNAARGKTYNITLSITNVTGSDLEYTSSIDDFNATDETGSPHIIPDSKLPVTASIKTWVAMVSQFTLQAQQSKSVVAQVTIPNDAEPGGHYGVLRFSGGVPEIENTGVGLSASAGVLILIRVDGIITEKANLASFYSALGDKQSSFFENSPIKFIARIQNEGNIHIKPVGNIELRDMFGRIVSTMTINEEKSNVLPSSIRRFEAQYNGEWMIGRYTASLTLGYGTTGQAMTSTISFWVIPYKLILAGLLILATIIFIFKRLIKVYNRRIIERAKNEGSTKNKNKIKKD